MIPANTRHSLNVGTMLGQRLRRWTNIVPALGEHLGGIIIIKLLRTCQIV